MSSSQLAHVLGETVTCESCLGDLEHCHGVALVAEWGVACSDDPDCTLSADLHQFVSYED
ncbi:MAG TPA: hypothetical protein VK704_08295 [Acidimicrobiales bacterium]|nr:hypothetical protein [Acidimicrobiales bacterium]